MAHVLFQDVRGPRLFGLLDILRRLVENHTPKCQPTSDNCEPPVRQKVQNPTQMANFSLRLGLINGLDNTFMPPVARMDQAEFE